METDADSTDSDCVRILSKKRARTVEISDDDSNEHVSKTETKIMHLIKWIKINRLLVDENTTDDILTECVEEISKLFGGKKEFLLFIVDCISDRSDTKKLESIHQIITDKRMRKQQQSDDDEENDEENDTHNQNDEILEETKNQNSGFKLLPNECIDHICGYLQRVEVASFKSTSRQIAIVGLEEMKKRSVGIYVMNIDQLQHDAADDDMSDLYKHIRSRTIWNRYPTSKRFHSLYDEWCQQYNIPEKYQLIFQLHEVLLFDSYHNFSRYELHLFHAQRAKTHKIYKQSSYFLCDSRNVIILTRDGVKKSNPLQICKNGNYDLMILKYFSITQQTSKIVQLILFEQDEPFHTLFHYIEHNFTPINGVDNGWYNELKCTLKQMAYSKHHPKLKMYQHQTNQIQKISGNDVFNISYGQLFTFQINHNNPYFDVSDEFDDARFLCQRRMDTFHKNADEYYKDMKNLRVYFKGGIPDISLLKFTIKYHYDLKCKTMNNQSDKIDLESILSDVREFVDIRMTVSSISGALRSKIAEMFGNIIEPKYIEIFRKTYSETPEQNIDYKSVYARIPWNESVSDNTGVYSLYYSIVLYDTMSFDD